MLFGLLHQFDNRIARHNCLAGVSFDHALERAWSIAFQQRTQSEQLPALVR
jgi:hypothetical protein